VLQLISRGVVTNFISVEIIREFEDVLARPRFGLRREQVMHIVALLRDSSEIVEPGEGISVVVDDSDDDRVLEAAKAAGAEFIVSGDRHLLDLREWAGIQILSPRDFLEQTNQSRG
jgi:putative PIN family toxin of toxin-antitoxin system